MSLLNVGTRALLANQAALSTTGHNIANAKTEGYSRQSVVQRQVEGQNTGNGYIGNGVQVVTVERQSSALLTRQSTAAQSFATADTTRATRLYQMEDAFPSGSAGLGAAVNDLMSAFSDATSVPNDLTARSVALARADELASRFRTTSNRLDDLAGGTRQEIATGVGAVNKLTAQIATLNDEIIRAKGSGQTPNDLLDQRDKLIGDLNGYVQTTQVAADDGSTNVFLGSQPLVLAGTATPLTTKTDDPAGIKLTIVRGGATTTLDENAIGGGSITGLLKFNNTDLANGRNLLGRMAVTVAALVNGQHQVGLDMNGNAGTALFNAPSVDNVYDGTGQRSTALSIVLKDPSVLRATGYQVQINASGTGGTLVRTADGSTAAFSVVSGKLQFAGGATTLDGLAFNVGTPAPAANSILTAKPFESAAGALKTAISNPRQLAVGSPIEPKLGSANAGTLAVSAITATPDLALPTAALTLTFTRGTAPAPDTYSYTGASGTVTAPYKTGEPIVIDGRSITLKGTPATGDTVTIQPASAAYRGTSSGNAAALAGLSTAAAFDGATLADGYSGVIAGIGLQVQSAQYAAQVSTSIASNLASDKSSISGVNLDEEASNLLMYQQSYQASAKMIQISQNIFDSLIQSVGR
jgi:flagellar hook-associated protein 1 FlgK